MGIWIRIALIIALAIVLWILVIDLGESVDGPTGSLGSSTGVGLLASHRGPHDTAMALADP
jgi:hypothetical protein